MKKILFATDFSKAATQDMNYVIELARKTGAEISILNAYFVPAVEFTGDMPRYTAMSADEKLHAERQLKDIIHLIANVKDDNGNYLTYKSIAELSDPVSAISRHVQNEEFDIVVIGSTGIDDPYRWYHSTAAELIKEISVPVLIVSELAMIYKLKHIVYAAELVKGDAEAIKQLVTFASAMNSWVRIMHIETTKSGEEINTFRALKKEVMQVCDYANVSWSSVQNESVKSAIADLINTDSIDLLSLLKHPRPVVDSLFHKSLTNALIKNSPIPLLVMHG